MADINKVTIIGRLSKDADVRTSNDGKSGYGNFTIASNRRVKNGDKWEDRGEFFECKASGSSYKGLGPYLTKGRQVAVSGYLFVDRWTSKDGRQEQKVRIFAETIQLLSEPKDKGTQTAPQPKPAPKPNGPEDFEGSDFDDLPDF